MIQEDLAKSKKRFYDFGFLLTVLIMFSFIMWLLSHIKPTVEIVIASCLAAYLLLPLVRFFENPIILTIPKSVTILKRNFKLRKEDKKITIRKKGFSRLVSMVLVYLLVALVIFIILSFVVPNLVVEFTKFLNKFPSLSRAVVTKINEFNEWLKPRLPENARDIIPRMLAKLTSELEKYIYMAAQYTFYFIQKVFSATIAILIIPIFTFYILMDREWFLRVFKILIPSKKRDEIMGIMSDVDKMLGKYIRGQIMVAVLLAVVITLALLILDVEYAFLIGILSGAVNIIPYLGVVIGLVPAVLLALIYKGFWWAVLVTVVLLTIQQLEAQVFTPAIIGDAIGLPALVIILAIIIGGQTLGFVGMLVAIPFVAALKIFVSYYLKAAREKEALSGAAKGIENPA